MTDGIGTTSWDFDDLSRPVVITDSLGSTVSYGYNAAGIRTAMTYPDDKSVSYVYDDAGRLQVVTGWDDLITSYTYDKDGRTQTAALPNGVSSTYIYDDVGNLESLPHVQGEDILSSFHYAYGELGNRTTVTETIQQPAGALSDRIFADGFESGDLSAWSGSVNNGNTLAATSQAAMGGNYGL